MPDVNERRERLLTALKAAADAVHGLDDDSRKTYEEGVNLVEKALAYARIVVEQTDPDLIPDTTLNGIEAGATAISANLPGSVGNGRRYVDNLLPQVATLPAARDRDVEQAVKETVANVQRLATQRLNAVEADAKTKTKEIEQALTTLRTNVDAQTASTETEIESRATAFEAKLAEFETTLSTQQAAIAAARERQSEAFTEAQEERAKTFQTEIAEASDSLAAMLEQARADVGERVDEIRRMERESSDLVGAIGLVGTAERYGEEAKEQKRVADRLRLATIGLALGAVVMAVFAVVHEADDTSAILAKLGVSVVFGALATYTGRQSGRHRVREERARNLQLELTAFAPFIEPLDDDQRAVERVVMTRKTFGQIAALPEADETQHSFGPLGPALDRITRRSTSNDGEK